MRLVATLLALGVARTTTFAVLIVTVLGHKALVPRPRLDQRSVHTEVPAREQALLPGDRHNFELALKPPIYRQSYKAWWIFATVTEHQSEDVMKLTPLGVTISPESGSTQCT